MTKLLIKHFGPIGEGLPSSDGWLDIRKVSLFLSEDHDTGTIVRVLATMVRIEKMLMTGVETVDSLKASPFKDRMPALLREYFTLKTELGYSGDFVRIAYLNGQLSITQSPQDVRLVPNMTVALAERSTLHLSYPLQPSPGSYLFNIVEEPELHLSPKSQWRVLESLLAANNQRAANKLVMTSHSPYVVNVLAIAAEAHQRKRQLSASCLSDAAAAAVHAQLRSIFDPSATTPVEDIAMYELETDGRISLLPTPNGGITDENSTNLALRRCNTVFEQLLTLEDEITLLAPPKL
jgi:hypothetical protein